MRRSVRRTSNGIYPSLYASDAVIKNVLYNLIPSFSVITLSWSGLSRSEVCLDMRQGYTLEGMSSICFCGYFCLDFNMFIDTPPPLELQTVNSSIHACCGDISPPGRSNPALPAIIRAAALQTDHADLPIGRLELSCLTFQTEPLAFVFPESSPCYFMYHLKVLVGQRVYRYT